MFDTHCLLQHKIKLHDLKKNKKNLTIINESTHLKAIISGL